MVRSRRERLLFGVVLLSVLSLGGSFLGPKLYQAWAGMDERIEAQQFTLSKLQAASQRKAGIEEKYLKTQAELTMDMHESAQKAQFEKELDALIRGAGLRYVKLESQERPQLEEDFKVLLIDVSQASGIPQQLGTFLYSLEHKSNVMDIWDLNITNDAGGRSRLGGGRASRSLTLNMQVARLVEYTTAEKNEIARSISRRRGR